MLAGVEKRFKQIVYIFVKIMYNFPVAHMYLQKENTKMKKNPFKRILCIVIAAVMLCSVFASTAAAATKCACGHSPVVMISGFGATILSEKQEDGYE